MWGILKSLMFTTAFFAVVIILFSMLSFLVVIFFPITIFCVVAFVIYMIIQDEKKSKK